MYEKVKHLRVLVNERAGVVDLVVDDHVQILLARVGRDLSESKFLRHNAGVWGVIREIRVLLACREKSGMAEESRWSGVRRRQMIES